MVMMSTTAAQQDSSSGAGRCQHQLPGQAALTPDTSTGKKAGRGSRIPSSCTHLSQLDAVGAAEADAHVTTLQPQLLDLTVGGASRGV